MAGTLGGAFLSPPSGMGFSSGSNLTFNNTGTQKTAGVVPMQGTGVSPTPQYAQPAAGVGGFKTSGFQYGQAPSAAVDTSQVGKGENYTSNMQDAYYDQARARLDPEWNQRQSGLESQLANMGLTRGSAAWDREMSNMTRGRNDAYGSALNSAILNSGAEAQRRQGMDIASQQSYNQAAGQDFGQRNIEAQLNNDALTRQQNAGQGWGQIEASRYAADQGLAGNMAHAAVTSQLGNRRYDIDEGQQQFDNSRTMRFDPIIEQNMLIQGMNPADPQFAQFQTPNTANYAQQIAQGTAQQNAGISDAAGSFGGYMFPGQRKTTPYAPSPAASDWGTGQWDNPVGGG